MVLKYYSGCNHENGIQYLEYRLENLVWHMFRVRSSDLPCGSVNIAQIPIKIGIPFPGKEFVQ